MKVKKMKKVQAASDLMNDTAKCEDLAHILDDIEYLVSIDNFEGESVEDYRHLYSRLVEELDIMKSILDR